MGKKNKKSNKKKGKKSKRAITQEAFPTRSIPKRSAVDDFLDETEMRPSERYGVIMFASPGETMRETFIEEVAAMTGNTEEHVAQIVKEYIALEHPKRAVKYVGGFATPEECRERIKKIMDTEPSFHIYAVENGKWLAFDPDPSLIEDENYREEQLNAIMRGKKMGEQRTKEFFRQQMRQRVERARLEGTKEGQEVLLQQEEPYKAVEFRAKTAAESIEELKEKIKEMENTRQLALQKMEKMRAEGKDKEEEADQKDSEARIRELIAQNKGADAKLEEDAETKEKLRELAAIENQRVWPENLAQSMAEHVQKKKEEAASDPQTAAMFSSSNIVPSQIRRDVYGQPDDKGKEEEE